MSGRSLDTRALLKEAPEPADARQILRADTAADDPDSGLVLAETEVLADAHSYRDLRC